jgi:hypothetical protein
MGAYFNSRLSETTVMRMLVVAYLLVGVLVTVRTLFLGATHQRCEDPMPTRRRSGADPTAVRPDFLPGPSSERNERQE